MADVPLPDRPCVRCRLIWKASTNNFSGTRFYLRYTGTPPDGPTCSAFATTIASAAASAFSGHTHNSIAINEVDVLDITTTTGASGQAGSGVVGTLGNPPLPLSTAFNCEYGIAQRYRGGKPRGYFPLGDSGSLVDAAHWSETNRKTFETAVATFFDDVQTGAPTSMSTVQHTNVSFYDGINKNSPPWRGEGYAYPPAYRPVALTFDITGYFGKALLGSQKRRLTSTTP